MSEDKQTAEAQTLASITKLLSKHSEKEKDRIVWNLVDMFELPVKTAQPAPPAKKKELVGRSDSPGGLFHVQPTGKSRKLNGPAMEETVAFVVKSGSVTRRAVMERFGISYESARQRIDRCVAAGRVEEVSVDGQTEKRYRALEAAK